MKEEYEPLSHRTFLLTMSPEDGQEIAEMAGTGNYRCYG